MSEQHNKMSEQHNSKYQVTSYLCNEGINDLSHLQTTSYNPTQYKPYLPYTLMRSTKKVGLFLL